MAPSCLLGLVAVLLTPPFSALLATSPTTAGHMPQVTERLVLRPSPTPGLADLVPTHLPSDDPQWSLPAWPGPQASPLSGGPPPMQQPWRPPRRPRRRHDPGWAPWAAARSQGQPRAAPARKGSVPHARGWSRASSLGGREESEASLGLRLSGHALPSSSLMRGPGLGREGFPR